MADNDIRDLLAEGTRLLWTASTSGDGALPARPTRTGGTTDVTRVSAGSVRWREWAVRRLGEGGDIAQTEEGFPTPGQWLDQALVSFQRLAWLPPFAELEKAGRLDAFMQACGREPHAVIGGVMHSLPGENGALAVVAPLADKALAVLVRRYGLPAESDAGSSWLGRAVDAGADATVAALVAAGAAWTPAEAARIASPGALACWLASGANPAQARLADGQSVLTRLYDTWHADKQGGRGLIQHLRTLGAGTPWAGDLLRLAEASALQRLHVCGTMKDVDGFVAKNPGWRGYATRSRLDALTQWLASNPGMALRWLILRSKVEPQEARQALCEAVLHNPTGVLRAVGEAFDDASGAGNKMGYLPAAGAAYGRRQPGKQLQAAAWATLFDAPDAPGLLGGGLLPMQGSKDAESGHSIDYGAVDIKKKRMTSHWSSRLDRVPPAWLWGRGEASQTQAAHNLRRMLGLDGDYDSKRNSSLGNVLNGFVRALGRAVADRTELALPLRSEGALWTRLLHSGVWVYTSAKSGYGNENLPLRNRPRLDTWDDALIHAAPLGASNLEKNAWLYGQVGGETLEALAAEISARQTQAALAGETAATRPRRRA